MMTSLQGKVAVVTGGAQGLGRGFSEFLLQHGAKVCIADIKVQAGEATVSAFNAKYGQTSSMFVKCDVTRESDVKDVFSVVARRYGHVDIVVNDAGISGEEHWNKMIDINLKGVVMGSQHGLEAMSKNNGGRGGTIINIASTAGLVPVFTTPVYVASKYGVIGYTRSMAGHPSRTEEGVSFACLCPAFTNTAILKRAERERDELGRKANKMMDAIGIMEVEQVVAAFGELLLMSNNNGIVMAVSKKKGIKIVHGHSSRL